MYGNSNVEMDRKIEISKEHTCHEKKTHMHG